MKERLLVYRKNEKQIAEYNEELADLEQEKYELDEEIKMSAANLTLCSGKNKKDFVKNNIDPQVIERENKLKAINKSIKKVTGLRNKLIAYQNNTRTIVQCDYGKMEQEVIELRFFKNYRVSEISREKEITENAVQKILKRVLEKT